MNYVVYIWRMWSAYIATFAFALFPLICIWRNRSQIGAVSTGTTTHIDEHCGCSPHSLFLGHVGRSEVIHCIASFTFALHCFASFAFALHCNICICTLKYIYISMEQLLYLLYWSIYCVDLSIIMPFKFDV